MTLTKVGPPTEYLIIQQKRLALQCIPSSKRPKLSIQTAYPTKLSIKIEGEIKPLHDKNRLNEFMTTKPALQK